MRVPDHAPGWAIFLDIDGTLLDLAAHPKAVRVDPAVPDMLRCLLEATGGAVALVSGRSVADIDTLFTSLPIPVAGQHGVERRAAHRGGRREAIRAPLLDGIAEQMAALARTMPGLILEDKGASLALHFRQSPELGRIAESETQRALAALGDSFELQPGSFVYEVKPAGPNKGSAIAEFMQESPFAGRIPVFVGDDATDEHGFRAVNRLGGHSVKVGPGPTQARWMIPDSASARLWLEAYALRFARAREASDAP